MTKLVPLAVVAAALALSACGGSQSAKEEAQADNVEMPAEEAISDVNATPVADSAAEPGADATAPAAEPAPRPSPDRAQRRIFGAL